MKEENIRVRVGDGVGWLLLDRGARANAYTDAMVRRMTRVLDDFAADEKVRAVVIASAVPGRFCAGADLAEIRSRRAADGYTIPSLALFDRLANQPQPTLAAVGGPAVAGGLEMALACDVRMATPDAFFALPETGLGIMPAAGGTWRLPLAVGQSLAREMILFGRRLSAEEALEAGLVSHLVPSAELMVRAEELAGKAAALDPLANRLAKEALNATLSAKTGRAVVEDGQSRLYARQEEERDDG